MKILFVVLLSICFVNNSFCRTDKLYLNSGCKNDTCFVNYLNNLYTDSISTNSSFSYQIAMRAYKISKEIKYNKGMAYALYNLSDYYMNQNKSSNAKEMIMLAINMAIKIKDLMLLANAYNRMGMIISDQGDYQGSIEYYKKAIETAKKINQVEIIAKAYINTGVSYFYQGDYSKTLENYLKGLTLFEELKDTAKVITSLNNLSQIYSYKKDYKNSIATVKKALNLALKTSNEILIADCYNNLFTEYYRTDSIQKAIECEMKAMEIFTKTSSVTNLVVVYNNLSSLYSKIGDHYKALFYSQKAVEYIRKTENFADEPFLLKTLATSYFNIKNYEKALKITQESIEKARKFNQRKIILDNYLLMANIFKQMNKYKESMQMMYRYTDLNDSLIKEEYENSIAELQAKYETEKKEKEIALLKKDNELQQTELQHQKTIKIAYTSGFILSTMLVVVVLFSYFQKKKDNKKLMLQNIEITNQRNEIEAQRNEIQQQRDIVLKQKEHIEKIHEEQTSSIRYAQKIQQAILPPLHGIKEKTQGYFLIFYPCNIVSGDFYWTVTLKETFVVAVADCTGHGVPGGFMSMLGITLLNEIVRNKAIMQANEILEQLRQGIIIALRQKGIEGEQKDGMDISLLVIDCLTNTCQWSGANNPMYIVAKNAQIEKIPVQISSNDSLDESVKITSSSNEYSLLELKPDSAPVAIHPEMKAFTNYVFPLIPNGCFYLFSDGFADQFGGEKNKKYGYKRLREFLLSIAENDIQEQGILLEKEFFRWKGTNEQIDDVTFMGFKF